MAIQENTLHLSSLEIGDTWVLYIFTKLVLHVCSKHFNRVRNFTTSPSGMASQLYICTCTSSPSCHVRFPMQCERWRCPGARCSLSLHRLHSLESTTLLVQASTNKQWTLAGWKAKVHLGIGSIANDSTSGNGVAPMSNRHRVSWATTESNEVIN